MPPGRWPMSGSRRPSLPARTSAASARPPIEDRQRRALRRQWPEHEVVDRMEPPDERLGRTRPEVSPERDRFVEIRATDVESIGLVEIREFPPVPADADPGDEPAAAQRIERRELLGEDDRIPLRDDDDARPEPQPRVPCGDPGEREDRVVVGPIVGGVTAAVDEDVIGRPHGLPAESFGDVGGGFDRVRAWRGR